MDDQGSLLILGLGNVICGDDGLGVAAVERLRRRYELPPGVRALDGGTLGLTLLGEFEGVEDVVLVDAVRVDAPPGTPVRLDGEAVETAARERLSVHQIGVADLLDALRLMGAFPQRLVLHGLVPRTIELGLGRSPEVEAALDGLVDAVAEEARRLGSPSAAGEVMSRFPLALATLPLALWACDAGSAPPGQPVVVPEARLASQAARDRGRRLYLEHCALCHGERADGIGRRRNLSSRPQDFTDPSWRDRVMPAEVYVVIRDGRKRTAMAGWKILDEEQTWDLVAYVLSVAEPSG